MRHSLFTIVLVFLSLSTVAAGLQQVNVPLGVRWSLPDRIPGYDDEASAPFLIADTNRTVYAFNSVWSNKSLIVVASKWTRDGGWTTPTDILLSPWKEQARIVGAFLDRFGVVHLAFLGGDDFGAGIFYSKAPLEESDNASAWSAPQLVGEDATTPPNAVITGDSNGKLFILYSGSHDGLGIYAIYSFNGGDSWTEPVIVSLVNEETHYPSALTVAVDGQGRLHALWTLANLQGNGDAIYYSRLDSEQKQWSDPLVFATRTAGDYEADWPSIVYYEDKLIVVYDDSFPATRWMRWSDDGGNTWSEPTRPFNHVGEYAHASYAIDSANYLHMFLGNRTTDTTTHGMWHSVWLGDRWSELEPVFTGPRITSGLLSSRFDPTAPTSVVSQGNVILVTWSTDPGAGKNGVWYSYATLDTPELPVAPMPTPVPTLTPTPRPSLSSFLTPDAPRPSLLSLEQQAPVSTVPSPAIGLIAATIPALVLITLVILLFWLRFQARR